jgi:hypothetical protein
MGREPYKYRIKLSGKEKRELRRAKKKGRKDARLVIRILIILWASEGRPSPKRLNCWAAANRPS